MKKHNLYTIKIDFMPATEAQEELFNGVLRSFLRAMEFNATHSHKKNKLTIDIKKRSWEQQPEYETAN